MLFIELNAPEHILEAINFQVLTAFWLVLFTATLIWLLIFKFIFIHNGLVVLFLSYHTEYFFFKVAQYHLL